MLLLLNRKLYIPTLNPKTVSRNILLDCKTGRAMLADFGSGCRLNPGTGEIVGNQKTATPVYEGFGQSPFIDEWMWERASLATDLEALYYSLLEICGALLWKRRLTPKQMLDSKAGVMLCRFEAQMAVVDKECKALKPMLGELRDLFWPNINPSVIPSPRTYRARLQDLDAHLALADKFAEICDKYVSRVPKLCFRNPRPKMRICCRQSGCLGCRYKPKWRCKPHGRGVGLKWEPPVQALRLLRLDVGWLQGE